MVLIFSLEAARNHVIKLNIQSIRIKFHVTGHEYRPINHKLPLGSLLMSLKVLKEQIISVNLLLKAIRMLN